MNIKIQSTNNILTNSAAATSTTCTSKNLIGGEICLEQVTRVYTTTHMNKNKNANKNKTNKTHIGFQRWNVFLKHRREQRRYVNRGIMNICDKHVSLYRKKKRKEITLQPQNDFSNQ